MSRLFVAVTIPAETRVDLTHALGGLALPGRRVAPGDWHVTLRFIGAAEDVMIDRIVHEMDGADLGPSFAVSWEGVGAFPRPERAAVLWVGAGHGAAELELLAATVDEALVGAGIERADRPFRPHLTLSRIRPPQNVVDLVAAGAGVRAGMRCSAAHLIRSDLARPPGSRYRVIESFPLA